MGSKNAVLMKTRFSFISSSLLLCCAVLGEERGERGGEEGKVHASNTSPCVRSKRPLCVHSKRSRVYSPHVLNVDVVPVHTGTFLNVHHRGRFERVTTHSTHQTHHHNNTNTTQTTTHDTHDTHDTTAQRRERREEEKREGEEKKRRRGEEKKKKRRREEKKRRREEEKKRRREEERERKRERREKEKEREREERREKEKGNFRIQSSCAVVSSSTLDNVR